MDTLDWIVGVAMVVGWVLLILHSPIFKPWFGFRRPPGQGGKWFE